MLPVSLLLATGAGIFWWSEHKYDFIPKRLGEVVPGRVYRSGQLTPKMLDSTVRKHNISTIVDLQLNDLTDEMLQGEVQYAAANGLRHFRFGLAGDGTGDVNRYVDAVDTVIQCARTSDPVLVHCAAGTQRTGGVVACYRLLEEGADPDVVVAELKKYDWNAEEDQELVDYLNEHVPYIADQLVARGTLEKRSAELPRLDY
jgi:protein tyrosine/serine phosphatase